MFPQRLNGLRTAAALGAAVIGVGLAALPAHAEEAPFDISAQGGGPPYDEFFYADGGAEAQSAYFLLSLQSDGDLVAIDNLHVEFGIDDLGGALALAIDRPQCTDGVPLSPAIGPSPDHQMRR